MKLLIEFEYKFCCNSIVNDLDVCETIENKSNYKCISVEKKVPVECSKNHVI